jgi:hypothetical protein
METAERPFLDLPAALVEEVLKHTEGLGQKMLNELTRAQKRRQEWWQGLIRAGLLRREGELSPVLIPTTCGVDGSYAIERLLASDLVAAAAVAVEGLTPPSETRYWPEPLHLVWVEVEPRQAEIGAVLRGLMIGMELELAAQAPHEVMFIDGSLTTSLIYFNQALNKSENVLFLRKPIVSQPVRATGLSPETVRAEAQWPEREGPVVSQHGGRTKRRLVQPGRRSGDTAGTF